jgi:hypothetical protein
VPRTNGLVFNVGNSGSECDILAYLRRLDEKMDRLSASMADLGRRVTSLESKVVLLHGDFAAQSERIDRIEQRLDRIERRLEIVPA